MTPARPGDAFHLDIDGTVIAGHYIEVDSPHRLLIGWDRREGDKAASSPALIEITFTPTGDSTTSMRVQFPGLSAEDAAFYRRLWARYLGRIAAAVAGDGPARAASS